MRNTVARRPGRMTAVCLIAVATTVVAACGDPLLDRGSALSQVAPDILGNSPNCLAVGGAIAVSPGFPGTQAVPSFDIATDNQNGPWLAWLAAQSLSGSALHVGRLTDGAWARVGDLGDTVGITDTGESPVSTVLLRFGNASRAYVAWGAYDPVAAVSALHLMQSDGGAWSDMPSGAIGPVSSNYNPYRFGFDINRLNNAAAVVWYTSDVQREEQHIYFDADLSAATGWVEGPALPAAVRPTVSAASGTQAYVAWTDSVPKVGGSLDGNFVPTTGVGNGNDAINANGDFATSSTAQTIIAFVGNRAGPAARAMAWEDTREGNRNIYYREGTAAWEQLGDSDTGLGVSHMTSPAAAAHVSLAIDGNDRPILVYEDLTAHQVVARAWDGAAWSEAVTLSRAVYSAWWPRLASASDGSVYVAWEEDNARIQVCRLR